MSNVIQEQWRVFEDDPVLQRIKPKGLPILFEDEDVEMGESSAHTRTCDILLYGLEFHFADRTDYRVFGNLNLHYAPNEPAAYVSPDLMVVQPDHPLPDDISSYQIGREGPAPVLTVEVLSFRTHQQGDLTNKPILYASLGIEEYILVDVPGAMLTQRLLLLRRQANGKWTDEQDADGGVTSRLGFRVIVDRDGQVRVVDTKSGTHYARPGEAQIEAEARRQAEERIRQLEEELARLRGETPKQG
ncbi:MAG: Uma2 family endonuclease [Gemmataceae bacterium]